MLRRLVPIILPLLLITSAAAAQTPAASPEIATSPWAITDSQDIEVDGTPIALSPDGQWLAGLGMEDDQVCAWDIETLSPSCVDVGGSVEAFLGGIRLTWAPESSAFAFVSGSIRRIEYGEVFIYHVLSGELIQLTDISATGMQQLYIGTAWTADSQHIVVGLPNLEGKESPQPAIGRIDRASGEMERTPLSGNGPNSFSLRTPPWVGENGSVFIAMTSHDDSGGVWRLASDDSATEQLVGANEEPGVVAPMIASGSNDSRYLNVISMAGLSVAEVENTFFLLDTKTGDLTPLDTPESLSFVAFAPDNETGLMSLNVDGTNRLHTIDLASGEITEIGNSPGVSPWLQYLPTWASNETVFLPADGILLMLDRAG